MSLTSNLPAVGIDRLWLLTNVKKTLETYDFGGQIGFNRAVEAPSVVSTQVLIEGARCTSPGTS